MKTKNEAIWLVLMAATAILLVTSLTYGAAAVEKEAEETEKGNAAAVEQEVEVIWPEDRPKRRHRRLELTDEIIERVMNRLKQTEPEKAKKLAKLQAKNPTKFKAEIRKVMREQLSERGRGGRKLQRRADMPIAGPGVPFKQASRATAGRSAPTRGRGKEAIRERMRQRHNEYLEWLELNYPERAKKLAELRQAKPELYMRRIALSMRKYGRIAEAAKENPELAEVLKEDLELKGKRDKLLRKIRAASDDASGELTKELKEVIGSRFDLIIKRKQIAYEQLRKRLEELKEQVKQSEAEVEKSKELKDEKVKERLEKLISRTERFNWD